MLEIPTRLAYAYDRLRALPPEVAGRIATAIGQSLRGVGRGEVQEELLLLELGVGTGRIALPLIARGYRYVALDLSPGMLEVFQKKVAGITRKVQILQADARAIPLPDESVDAVIVVHLWHLLPEWTRALAEALRVLRPGGVLLEGFEEVEAPEVWALQERWRALVQEEGWAVERGLHVRRLGEVEETLKRLGLKPKTRVVAAWSERTTVREALEALGERVYSFTQRVPLEVHERAMARLWAWAQSAYPHLDQALGVEKRFSLRVSYLL